MVRRFKADKPLPRQEKISSLIHATISNLLLSGDILNVSSLDLTISAVTVSPDLRQASIYVVPFPSKNGKKYRSEEKILQDIINARKFIRFKIAQSLTLKICPDLNFFQDMATENSKKFEKLLSKIYDT